VSFPPVSDNFYFPLLTFEKFTCFYMLCVYFVSPYCDHAAFMHHTMHVLDAPVRIADLHFFDQR